MSDRQKEAEEKMAKAIFISADCWLCVFELLTPSQLGFGIAMISQRFNIYVDEHFKTQKWTLAHIQIRSKIGKNGTKEMEIVNSNWKSLPIPQIQMPQKVIGFKRIIISFIDQTVIAFLHRFRQLFASFCPINLFIGTNNDRIAKFILRNIWPNFGKNIHCLRLSSNTFHRLRKFVPSILIDCPSLHVDFSDFGDLFPEFPADDNAMASDGKAVAKWLFTPLQNDVPNLFKCNLVRNEWENWPLKIDAFKAAFVNASSSANFIVSIWFRYSVDFVVPFDLINELTREQLALKRINFSCRFLLIRRPIARDESKWAKWEEEAIVWQTYDQWNQISIYSYREDEIGDGLLDETPGPSDQQQK
ncbi:hypothetical protein niasHT_026146 [Heterodera trifolii]|uniref:F-box domain-containing protein n=1 Tax=Heterodera trifolii TaxID=157864 RepID=A0ABD2K004_9BILA